jgi:hypothetical protein
MDPSPQTLPDGLPSPGELVVCKGRLNGTRRPLNAAVTVIGRAEGCDVRLNADDVLPVHCALVNGPEGVTLRCFSGAEVLVNETSRGDGLLTDDDCLTVGRFEFLLRLGVPREKLDSAALECEREALRIQAAAVVAQQAALTEEESRLIHRRQALEHQETQLAAHLEERQKQLKGFQQKIRESRQMLRRERAEHEKHVAETTDELLQTRKEVRTAQDSLDRERKTLSGLVQRLKKRYGRHAQADRAAIEQRERDLTRSRAALEREKAILAETRLRFNGEVEVRRRQLTEDREQLRRAEERVREREAAQDADGRRRSAELAARAAALDDAERLLADERHTWQTRRTDLEREAEGLESRVRNLRRKLQDHEQEALRLGLTAHAPIAEPGSSGPSPRRPVSESESIRLAHVEALSCALADQRLHLLEQAERLTRARDEWHREQSTALAALESTAEELRQREENLLPHERSLSEAEDELRTREESAAQHQVRLEAWRIRLTARQAESHAEHAALLDTVRAREQRVERQAALLTEMRKRWSKRRQQEIEEFQSERAILSDARRRYAVEWESYVNRIEALEHEGRAVAERALALEQYRLEVVARAPDSPAAEKRLEKLRRRCSAVTASALKKLIAERQGLGDEAERLTKLAEKVQVQSNALARREAELAQQRSGWEKEQLLRSSEQARLESEMRGLKAQRERAERQLQTLRDEVERLARLLFEEGPPVRSVMAA